MDTAQFWSLIDRTTSFKDQDGQLEALDSLLDRLPPDGIGDFERAFQHELARTRTWDLWGAYAVIHGGSVEEGFEYFQRWLISRGRDVFEFVLTDADELADIIPEGTDEPCEFEEFSLVATDVWARKTGNDPLDDPSGPLNPGRKGPAKLAGTPVKETPAHLSRRYPRLWERFGDEPLG
ncbi:DUF4240 domain-containing protein [Aestuariivirga sp.]|uniref:DUF4240 domain-containing protein n=1 Tax=Aestuariivirga sp. TaxID=2650926 RepID=UPI0035932482